MPEVNIQVTVVIPMRNEARYIGKCLDSVLANDFPNDRLEILVVDGRSTDDSRAIVEQRAAGCSNVRILDNPKKIVPVGLNMGIREARGEYVVILGAHADYPPNYLSTCIAELRRTNADVVGGTLKTRPGADTAVAEAIALLSQHPFGVGGSGFRVGWGDRYVDTVPYPAYVKEVLVRAGLYNESLVRHQDFELNARIRASGGRIFLSSKLQNTYYNVPTLYQLARQAFRNGLWLGRAWVRCPGSFSWRHAVPAMFVASVLGSALLALFSAPLRYLPGLVLLPYMVLALVSAAQLAWRNGVRFFLLLPGLFFIHHFVYGVGTIGGVLTGHSLVRVPNPPLQKSV